MTADFRRVVEAAARVCDKAAARYREDKPGEDARGVIECEEMAYGQELSARFIRELTPEQCGLSAAPDQQKAAQEPKGSVGDGSAVEENRPHPVAAPAASELAQRLADAATREIHGDDYRIATRLIIERAILRALDGGGAER